MNATDAIVRFCGLAGDGIVTVGRLLAHGCAGMGLDFIVNDSFGAEIRGGGKSSTTVRIANRRVRSMGDGISTLVAIAAPGEAWLELPNIRPGGFVLFDADDPPQKDGQSLADGLPPEVVSYGVGLTRLAAEATGTHAGRNLVALGALCHALSLPADPFVELIRSNFRRKGERVVEANLKCFRLGHTQAGELHPEHTSLGSLTSMPLGRVVNGNEALALGALDAGLKFFAGYPITPATSIMEMVAKELPRLGGWMHQAEDEIAAAGAMLGAAYAGKRAMTATSGPGLALMSEMIGLAVMAEIPAVIVDVQRGGPATGLPTKVEQADLNIALFGGAGDCPRVVMAPSTCGECYTGIQLAMDLAEKYQTPVVFLSDLFLANRVVVTDIQERRDLNRCTRKRPAPEDLETYERFQAAEDGVSPWLVPGEEGAFYTITGLEHSARGNPNYEVGVHQAMTEKRFRKFESMLADIPPAEVVGDEDAAIGFSAWGSPTGAIIEGMEIARAEGIKSKLIRSLMIYPQPEASYRAFFDSCERIVIPEMNFQGQYAAVMKARYGIRPTEIHLPGVYPVSPEEIAQVIREVNDELVGKTPSLAGC